MAVVVSAGNPDNPPGPPETTNSYTLEDIYDRLDSGAAGAQSAFTEPSSGPPTGTMHTLNEIMAVAPQVDDTNGATAATYGNTSATDYGVNRGEDGKLSGYAWGTNVGWINFDPGDGGVTIDPASGDFSGHAWGENVGWISFNSSGPVPYKVSMLLCRIYLSLVIKGA